MLITLRFLGRPFGARTPGDGACVVASESLRQRVAQDLFELTVGDIAKFEWTMI
ncbi:hypothetical protein [Rhodococcus globerulus]|uniref:hypothetical protein n=1 Tax=Rhodococcus globerulus TaxID=33008 RepID=UPI001586CE4F|nr:hypothetical protein [Rhodococcus globerulus]